MSQFLHRSLDQDLPVAVRGEGCYIFDAQGRKYLDGSGGAAVACLGHSHPRVIAAVEAQIRKLPCIHTSFFTNEPSEELAEFLVARAPVGIARFLTVSDGSVAVETALKLQRQYWVERGQPQRRFIISRQQSYHGNTLGALAVGGNARRRAPYAPLLAPCVEHIAPCFAYRHQRTDETPVQYGLRSANLLEEAILRLGAENVGAFIAEPVVGATAGCVAAAPGYFKRIREICDRYEVLFIADEIMCGMGRTGSLFACEQEGVVPDIITVAKGLGGGYQPVGGVFAHRKVMQAIEGGTRALANGHTYMGHAVASAAALAVQKAIEEEHLVERVRVLGQGLGQRLRARLGDHPMVGDIRGRGLFWAVELVADRASKQTFAPSLQLHQLVKQEAMRRGLVCYPSGGTADGVNGDHVLVAPPYIVTEAQLDDIVDIAGAAIDAAIDSLPH